MHDFSFKRFKIRYFIITFFLLMVLMIAFTVSFMESQFVSDLTQLMLSIGLTAYMLWQTKAKNITYHMVVLNEPMSKKRWAKYVALTIGTKLYAQLLVAFLGTAFVVVLFDFIQAMFEFIGEVPIVTVETSMFHYVVTFISICILAPIWEELFFRGILLRRLLMKWRAPVSIVVSSIIFGLFHINAGQVLYAGILGLLFGYVYLRTGNMLVPIVLHSVANFVSFFFLVQLGGQSSDGIIAEFMKIDKQILEEQLLYLGILAIVSTIVLAVIVVKNYRHVKAIPKLERTIVEEVESN